MPRPVFAPFLKHQASGRRLVLDSLFFRVFLPQFSDLLTPKRNGKAKLKALKIVIIVEVNETLQAGHS